MAIDIKKIVENVVERISSDEELKAKFMKEPVKVIEKVTKVDLPDEQIEKVIGLVKAKIQVDGIAGIAEKVKKIDDISDVAEIAQNLGNLKGLGKLFGK